MGGLWGWRQPGPGTLRAGKGAADCTWGRIGRHRTRRSGWCGPRRAPPPAPPYGHPLGCARCPGAACRPAAARTQSRGRSESGAKGDFFARLAPKENTFLSRIKGWGRASSGVGVAAPGRARPLPVCPGIAAASGRAEPGCGRVRPEPLLSVHRAWRNSYQTSPPSLGILCTCSPLPPVLHGSGNHLPLSLGKTNSFPQRPPTCPPLGPWTPGPRASRGPARAPGGLQLGMLPSCVLEVTISSRGCPLPAPSLHWLGTP